jgi:hypothetical protein
VSVRASIRQLWRDPLPWLPVGGAAVYAGAFAHSFARITNAFAWNADLVSPLVLAESLGQEPSSRDVVFGTFGPYTVLWFNLLTKPLPSHREIWQAGPYAFALFGFAVLAWASYRLAGHWAAAVTFAVAFCASSPVLLTMMTGAHGPAYAVMCVLAGFLLLIATRPLARATTIAVTVVVGCVAGVNLASDPLLFLVGLIPLVGAAVLLVGLVPNRENVRVLTIAGGTALTAVVVGLVSSAAMRAAGFHVLGATGGEPMRFATGNQIGDSLGQLSENALSVMSTNFLGKTLSVESSSAAALAGPALAAALLPVGFVLTRVRSRAGVEASPVRMLYIAYWALVVAVLCAAVVFSSLGAEAGDRSINYMTPLVLAVAATLPLIIGTNRGRRAAVGVGAGLFCALSATAVLQNDIVRGYELLSIVRHDADVLEVLERDGVSRGYGHYATAAPLTFNSKGALEVYPVFRCLRENGRESLCGFFANRIESWYRPRASTPTFVIVDVTLPNALPSPPPAALGRPSKVHTVGSLRIFVFPYDVAQRFGPTY